MKGFTLIELMIVVAIIGILASIAIPGYQDYVAKTQVSEAVILLDGLRTSASEFYTNQGTTPSVADVSSTSVSGKYVDSVTIIGAGTTTIVIQATMGVNGVSPNIAGQTYAIATVDGTKTWSCGMSTGVVAGYTSISEEYIPTACK